MRSWFLRFPTEAQERNGWGLTLRASPSLSPLFYQGHTLRSRPWETPGDAESGTRPSTNPLCSLLTFNDFNAEAVKNKVPPLPCLCLGDLVPDHP